MSAIVPAAITARAHAPSYCQPTGGRLHLPDFCRQLGLTIADLAPFGPELRVSGRILEARHTDCEGCEVGWELIHDERRFAFKPGGRKALFRSPPAQRHRLLLAAGPLPALCAAALEGRHADTCYAAPGGPWTRAAADAAAALIAGGIREVALAFGPSPVGLRSTEQAAALVRACAADGVTISVLMPTAGTWTQALREARGRAPATT
jgi:hypothetical protein